MHVDFGFFERDRLIQKGAFVVTENEGIELSNALSIKHRLSDTAAEIVIEAFAGDVRVITSTLNMPVHESEDWESIELAQFTFAFRCRLNA